MMIVFGQGGKFRRALCWTLAAATATAPAITTFAQTNAAAMAIRARLEGTTPEGPGGPAPPGAIPPGPGQPGMPEMSAGKLDTRYIAPAASIIVVARPAQLLASPLGQLFPHEVASAAALKNLGFDAVEMDEVVGFGDLANPLAPAYGVTFKFKNPIRATSIPPQMRAHAQLADLGGKKYLRSSAPMMWSLYGPNNKTLVAASDAALHQLVETASQPKTGPLMDRLREVAAGSDLYVAMDLVKLQPFIQMGLANAQAFSKGSPVLKQIVDKLNLVSAFELTLNVSNPGPTSLVLHCADDTAAQSVETSIQEILQKARAARQTDPAGADEVSQAMDRYTERMLAMFQPQRSGTSITCIHMNGQDPAQQKLVEMVVASAVINAAMPAIQAARNAAMKQPGGPGPGGPATGPAGPASPAPPGAPGAEGAPQPGAPGG